MCGQPNLVPSVLYQMAYFGQSFPHYLPRTAQGLVRYLVGEHLCKDGHLERHARLISFAGNHCVSSCRVNWACSDASIWHHAQCCRHADATEVPRAPSFWHLLSAVHSDRLRWLRWRSMVQFCLGSLQHISFLCDSLALLSSSLWLWLWLWLWAWAWVWVLVWLWLWEWAWAWVWPLSYFWTWWPLFRGCSPYHRS